MFKIEPINPSSFSRNISARTDTWPDALSALSSMVETFGCDARIIDQDDNNKIVAKLTLLD